MAYPPNQEIIEVFYEYTGETGLSVSDFTVNLFLDGAISVVAVSITEISGGFYKVSFTPDAEGFWALDIVKDTDNLARYQSVFKVEEPFTLLDEDVQNHLTPGSVGDYINHTKKYTCNKVVLSGTTYAVKEDDQTTDFETGTSTATERSPD